MIVSESVREPVNYRCIFNIKTKTNPNNLFIENTTLYLNKIIINIFGAGTNNIEDQ